MSVGRCPAAVNQRPMANTVIATGSIAIVRNDGAVHGRVTPRAARVARRVPAPVSGRRPATVREF